MYLIVGLGNPGKQYEKTRHNVGFIALDRLLSRTGADPFSPDTKRQGEVAKGRVGDKEVILFKPATYMNLSGNALSSVLNYYKIEPDKVIVISDDANLETGQVRIRFGGESGGHKGLGSIIEHSGRDFWRVRIGIGANDRIALDKYVLQKMSGDEEKAISSAIDKAVNYLIESISADNLENKTIN